MELRADPALAVAPTQRVHFQYPPSQELQEPASGTVESQAFIYSASNSYSFDAALCSSFLHSFYPLPILYVP